MLRPAGITLDRYRYMCSNVIVAMKGKTDGVTIPADKVMAIDIIKKFDSKIVPYISITMTVPKADFLTIQSNITLVTVTLSIDKYKVTTSDNVMKANSIKGTFKAIDQNLIDPVIVGQYAQPDGQPEDTIVQDSVPLRLFLYDEDKLKQMRQMMSLTITGNLTDALYHSFNKRSFTDVLMSPLKPDKHDTFCIPYGTLKSALEYLNMVHGIYEYQYVFFMDFDTTYLIDINQIGKTFRSLECGIVSMYMEAHGSAESGDIGCYVDTKSIVLNLNKTPTITEIEQNIEHLMWGKLTCVSSSTNEIQSAMNGDGTNVELERAVIVDNFDILTQYTQMVDENRNIISIVNTDVDIDIFNPNKAYYLFDDIDYEKNYRIKGRYRLTDCIISLLKEGESGMKVTVQSQLKKQYGGI